MVNIYRERPHYVIYNMAASLALMGVYQEDVVVFIVENTGDSTHFFFFYFPGKLFSVWPPSSEGERLLWAWVFILPWSH